MSEGANIAGNVQGDVIGAGFSGDGNIIAREYEVHGNVYHFNLSTPEAVREAAALASLPTEVRPRGAGPAADASVQRRLDEALAQVTELQARGVQAPQVDAGGVHLSRVDLLIKKAVLLVTEAEQSLDDDAGREEMQAMLQRLKDGTLDLSRPGGTQDDTEGPYFDKLREAHAALTEARALEPYNAEVLLNLAKVNGLLERPDQEGDLLEMVLAQLDAPRTDTERLHRAQALYMMATLRDVPDADRLREARALFAALGRDEWVRLADQGLRVADLAGGHGGAWAGAPGQVDAWGGGQDHDDVLGGLLASLGLGGLEQQPAARPDGFGGFGGLRADAEPDAFAPTAGAQHDGAFPVGRWNVEIQHMGSMMLEMRPDGSLSGAQAGPGGIRFDGGWEWAPPYLVLGATMDGVPVFTVQIAMEQTTGHAMQGTGLDGERFRFVRA